MRKLITDLGKTLCFTPDEFDEDVLISRFSGVPINSILRVTYELLSAYREPRPIPPELYLDMLSNTLLRVYGIPRIAVERAVEQSISATRLQADTLEFLELATKTFDVTLLSNATPVDKIRLSRLSLERYFHRIVFSCDTGYWKPDPRAFLSAIDGFGDAVVIGDRIRTLTLGLVDLPGVTKILVERRMESGLIRSSKLPVAAIAGGLMDVLQFLRESS